jgi:hypothetical protein
MKKYQACPLLLRRLNTANNITDISVSKEGLDIFGIIRQTVHKLVNFVPNAALVLWGNAGMNMLFQGMV